jgi:uncharacterized glyoxalase superfamily protein PhnB
MHADVEEPGRTIVPTLRYRDVAAAIEWLCGAFGFERHLVVPGEDGAVRYAELIFGDGMIMLGPVEDSAFGGLMTQPADAGGAETQICYLFVADAAAHRARAKAAGADIVLDIEEEDGGARGYSCRDPEGHIWNFGTYDPRKRRLLRAEPARQKEGHPRPSPRRAAVAIGLLIAMAASALAVWSLGAAHWTSFEPEAVAAAETGGDAPARAMHEQLTRAREGREAAERAIRDVREQLAKERSTREAAERAREAAERTAKDTREQLGKVGVEGTAGEMRELREQLANEKSARAAARRLADETREQLALAERANEAMQEQLRAVRDEAERAVQQAREQLVKEQSAKEDAERAKQARDKAAKERAAKEAEQAEEARERQRNAKRPPRPQAAAPSPGITPFTIWPR